MPHTMHSDDEYRKLIPIPRLATQDALVKFHSISIITATPSWGELPALAYSDLQAHRFLLASRGLAPALIPANCALRFSRIGNELGLRTGRLSGAEDIKRKSAETMRAVLIDNKPQNAIPPGAG